MTSKNGQATAETTMFTAHAAAAKCLARVVAVSIDACDGADMPLSELQKAAVIEAALLEFDGFGLEVASLAAVGELLRDLGHL
jgi:hypothetical protein